ncbi:MAG: hypothetical protein E7504_07405 [Ruminococcus sp.]|nr:hypothetical protein [Ruminococcus sp.]
MEDTISTSQIVEFALTTLGVFAAIFALAVLTPWMAKKVDAWIARYRENHSPTRDETYSVRSIYELPPKKPAQQPEQTESEKTPEEQ